jgi:hypothetical protein
VARGNSPRITAGVADKALITADEFEDYLRAARVVDIELLRLGRQLREVAEMADVADYTLGVALSALRVEGVMGERFWRSLTDLRSHVMRRRSDGDAPGPVAPAMKKAA